MDAPRRGTVEREMETVPHVVLIVDDDLDTLVSLREVLAGEPDERVLVAHDGPEALAVLGRETVDLLVVDHRMPGMTGLELLDEVKARHPAVERVMITAYADLQIALRAINEGRVKRFFTKPLDARKILETVGELRAAHRSHANRTRAFATGLDLLRGRAPPEGPHR